MSQRNLGFLFIALAFGVWSFLLQPAVAKLSEVRADFNSIENARLQIEELSKKSDQLSESYRNVRAAYLQKLDRVIPKGPQTAGLVTDFETLALRYGLKMRSLDFQYDTASAKPKTGQAGAGTAGLPGEKPAAAPGPASPNSQPGGSSGSGLNISKGAQQAMVGIELLGSYSSFVSFLKDLELHERLTDISSINFGSQAGDRPISFRVQGRIYYQNL